MILLLLLAPSGFSFFLLLSMARLERWALDLDGSTSESAPMVAPAVPAARETIDSSPVPVRPRELWLPIVD